MSTPSDDFNFLVSYMKLNEGTEIPRTFAFWCGLSAVSCMLERRIWLDLGPFKIYPNMYVVLVAGSGRCRKSTAIGMAERLLRQVQPSPNIVSQTVTPQALIEALKVDVNSDKTLLAQRAVGFGIVDELVTFLNKLSYEAGIAALLIKLWDCTDKYEYRTKGRGIELLENSCFGLLGGTTVDLIRAAIPTDAIGSGLTSRMLLVYEEKAPPPVAFPEKAAGYDALVEQLVRALQRLTLLDGEAKLAAPAKAKYVELYNEFFQNSKMFDDPYLSGYASRRFVHMLKVALLLSVCRRTDLIVTFDDICHAHEMLLSTEQSMPRVLRLIASNEKGSITDAVLNFIAAAGERGVTRTLLMRFVANKIDARELTMLTQTLQESGQISMEARGGNVVYKVKGL